MELPDRRVDEYSGNVVIDNLIDQVDDQKRDTVISEEIVYFRCDPDAIIPTGAQAYTNVNGIQIPVITTNGWHVQVKWRHQNTILVHLNLIKESNSIVVAEYSSTLSYSNEPDFI